MVKKAVFRTLEAMMALFISFTVLLVFMPRETIDLQTEPSGFLKGLQTDDVFRNCIISENTTCVHQIIDTKVSDSFDFAFNISSNAEIQIGGLPSKRVLAESLYIAGNTSNSTSKILRVLYWSKN